MRKKILLILIVCFAICLTVGVLNACSKHEHSLTLVARVEADCATGKAGNTEYYTCSGCDKWFEDADGKNEITDHSSVIIPFEHDYTDVAWSKGSDGHWKVCNVCHQSTEPEQHIPGPAATETSPQTCTECGYILAEPHTHKPTLVARVEPDCATDKDGNIEYYACTCGRWFEDENGDVEITDKSTVVIPATHGYEDKWNESQHWQKCSVCGNETNKADHDHEGANGICSACEFDFVYITLGDTAYVPEDEVEVSGLAVAYSEGKYTLTLNNAILTEALTVYGANAEIVVSTDSTIAEIRVYGSLTISGSGKLTVNASGDRDGLQVQGELNISATEVTVSAQTENDKSGVNSEGLTVAENTKLTVSEFGYGIYMAGNVTIANGATVEISSVKTGMGTYSGGLTLTVDGTLTMTEIGDYALRFANADGSLVVNGTLSADNVIRVARITVGSETVVATLNLSANERDLITNDADGKTAGVYNFVNGSVTLTNRKAERGQTAINMKVAGDSVTIGENCTLTIVNFSYAVGSWDGAITFENNGTLVAGEANICAATVNLNGETNVNEINNSYNTVLTINGGEHNLITIGSVDVSTFKIYSGTVTVSGKVKAGYFYVGNKSDSANGVEDNSIPAPEVTIRGNVEINDGSNEFRLNHPNAVVTIYGQLKIYGDKNSYRLYVRQGTLTVDNSANAKSAAIICARVQLGNSSGEASGTIVVKTNDADAFTISGISQNSADYDLYTGSVNIENITSGGTAFGLNAGGSSNLDVHSGATVTVKNFYCVIGAWDPSTIWCGNSGTIKAENCTIGTNGIAGWYIDGNQSHETNDNWYNIQH